jgi:hypothetical protein
MLNANNTLFNAGVGTAGALNSNTAAGIAGASAIPGLALAPATAQVGAANTQQQLPFQNLLAQLQAAGMLGGMGGTELDQRRQGDGYADASERSADEHPRRRHGRCRPRWRVLG